MGILDYALGKQKLVDIPNLKGKKMRRRNKQYKLEWN